MTSSYQWDFDNTRQDTLAKKADKKSALLT